MLETACANGWYRFAVLQKRKNIIGMSAKLNIVGYFNLQVDYNNYFCVIHDITMEIVKMVWELGRSWFLFVVVWFAYLMGIEIDPYQYKLVFEPVYKPRRVTPCDIDTDFQQSRRQKLLHQYVYR